MDGCVLYKKTCKSVVPILQCFSDGFMQTTLLQDQKLGTLSFNRPGNQHERFLLFDELVVQLPLP